MASNNPHQDNNSIHRGVLSKILFCPAEERTARELQQLPKAQREQVWADMMGHPENTLYRMAAEDPQMVAQKLREMKCELSKQKDSEKRYAYDQAVQQDANFVHHRMLRFLRVDEFDPQLAAERMIVFFQHKLNLFGLAALGRPIRLEDFTADDFTSLQSGGMQVLPLQDHAGRGIIFTRQQNYVYKDRNNMLRTFFYIGQCLSDNEQVQKVGCVSISYQVGGYPSGGYDYELTRNVSKLVSGMPLRFVSIYLCYSASPWERVADLISHLVSPFLRVRLRSVQGSHQECLYKLMTLGIPNQAFPVTDEGESLLQNHHLWIQQRMQLENYHPNYNNHANAAPVLHVPTVVVDDDDDDDDDMMMMMMQDDDDFDDDDDDEEEDDDNLHDDPF